MLKITRKEGLMKKLALTLFLAFCCLSVAQPDRITTTD